MSEAPKGLHKRGAIVSVRLSAGDTVKPHHHVPGNWPAPIRGVAWLSRVLAVLEGVGIGACLLAVVGLATWQFIERNLTQRHLPFFHVPPWTDGVIRHSVFMLGFLGGAYATYTGRHIRIDAVTRVVKAKKRMALRVLTTVMAIIIVGVFTKAAFGFYRITLQEAGEASQAEELFTPARGALIIVIGYAVIAFHFFVQALIDVCWLISRAEPPAEWIAEAAHGAELPAEDSAVAAAHDPEGLKETAAREDAAARENVATRAEEPENE
ncbi:MAG TPA: TRAP transporter small permease [Polyangia bacterium]|nr:TRAP transporter small permease [Polyangia bacterium]